MEVVQRIVIIAQARACDGSVVIGVGEYGIMLDGEREVGVGTQQVVKIVLGNATQEVTLVGLGVEAQQGVENTNRFGIVLAHHKLATHPEEILTVVLCRCREGRQYNDQSE